MGAEVAAVMARVERVVKVVLVEGEEEGISMSMMKGIRRIMVASRILRIFLGAWRLMERVNSWMAMGDIRGAEAIGLSRGMDCEFMRNHCGSCGRLTNVQSGHQSFLETETG